MLYFATHEIYCNLGQPIQLVGKKEIIEENKKAPLIVTLFKKFFLVKKFKTDQVSPSVYSLL
jgi:hypothetical protein